MMGSCLRAGHLPSVARPLRCTKTYSPSLPTPSLMNNRALSPASVTRRRNDGLHARPIHPKPHDPHVHYAEPHIPRRVAAKLRQRLRIQQFQQQWQNIKADLPPQLSRRHSKCRSLRLVRQSSAKPLPRIVSRHDLHRWCHRYRFIPWLRCT